MTCLVWFGVKEKILKDSLASLGWPKVALGGLLENFVLALFVFDPGVEVFLFSLLEIYLDSCLVLKIGPWYTKILI